MRATRALSGGGIGYLLAGQSGCREQPISAQGRLERVLQQDTRARPPTLPKSRARLAPTGTYKSA
jgi:hypothetical protein